MSLERILEHGYIVISLSLSRLSLLLLVHFLVSSRLCRLLVRNHLGLVLHTQPPRLSDRVVAGQWVIHHFTFCTTSSICRSSSCARSSLFLETWFLHAEKNLDLLRTHSMQH